MHMLKLIAGKKGSGKTKQLITMVNSAVEVSNGKVVCIDKGTKLTYDINHGARLLDTESFHIAGYESFYGFLAGIEASDYDVKEIFVDSILKIAGDNFDEIEKLVAKIDKLFGNEVSVFITISADPSELPDGIKKYI
jgi:energy-coupling factor transporter ATP-binding protein EcfA2